MTTTATTTTAANAGLVTGPPTSIAAFHPQPPHHTSHLHHRPPPVDSNPVSPTSSTAAATALPLQPSAQAPHPQLAESRVQPSHTPSSSGTSPAPLTTTAAAAAVAAAAAICRQIRQPKSPLYVPAALRPTEKPTRHHPRGSTSSSSMDGMAPDSRGASRGSDGTTAKGAVGKGRLQLSNDGTGMGEYERAMLSPEISRIVTDEWNDAALGKVTGPPTRNHWKPDSSAPNCAAPSCTRPFAFLSHRRHHCRRCGNVFCATHSPHSVPLDQHARFHPQGSRQRACDLCWADFRAWRAARPSSSSLSTTASSESARSADGVGTPPRSVQGLSVAPRGFGEAAGLRAGSIASSVPQDWNWSTF